MDHSTRARHIETALRSTLHADHIEILDRSARHAGHPGTASGAGHYAVLVVSSHFEGLSRVAAQRLVYDALADLMDTEIHALQLRTLTPSAWHQLPRSDAATDISKLS